ncbi:MAG: hypothetical protein ACRC41_07805 [Sarcina sp.]
MMNDIRNTELEEALTLLNCYDELNNTVAEAILEDINEEVHCTKFLKLIEDNNNQDI